MDKKLEDEDEDLVEVELEEDGFDELGAPPLTDENITQEQINEIKMLGLPKPNLVSWERWQRIQDIRHEHEHMIHLAASGLPQQDIAEALGYDHVHVSKILRHPDVKAKVSQRIDEIYGSDHKKAILNRGLKSIKVVDEILETGKESEKASMAKWVLEHSVGKATQEIKETKTSLNQFILEVRDLKQNQLRDVGGSTESLSNIKSPFDTIIDEIIPKGIVIGKRSSGEGQTE